LDRSRLELANARVQEAARTVVVPARLSNDDTSPIRERTTCQG
jgi:hypothetical protein